MSEWTPEVTVPRALLVMCEDLLSGLSSRILPSEDEDYELTLAQLRVILK